VRFARHRIDFWAKQAGWLALARLVSTSADECSLISDSTVTWEARSPMRELMAGVVTRV
jgi:hypothetical protein